MPSRLAHDVTLTWPLALATLYLAGLWAFIFFAFSGRVALTDPTVAGLVGSALTQAFGIASVIASHFYHRGKPEALPKDQQNDASL